MHGLHEYMQPVKKHSKTITAICNGRMERYCTTHMSGVRGFDRPLFKQMVVVGGIKSNEFLL